MTLFAMFGLQSCDTPQKNIDLSHLDQELDKIPAAVWQKISDKKIYFAHQSVGINVIEGIQEILRKHPTISLNIVETANQADFKAGIFAHSAIGENFKPDTKTAEFISFMEQGIGENADTVALKYCFLDINAGTAVDKMFHKYSTALDKVSKDYTKLNVIHFTMPLEVHRPGKKAKLKKFFGVNEIKEYDDNAKRNEYNEMLLDKYQGREPIFDLAKFESSYPDGSRSSYERKGKTYYALAPEFSRDGAHLNELGRKQLAGKFLLFLAKLHQ